MEGLRLGRYRLGRRLATGGMAEVFAATVEGAAGFQKPVAIKRILPHLCEDPEFVEMFRDEARLASRLSHANIAQVFDFDEVDGQYLLAMEWVHGRDLKRVLRAAAKAGLPPSPARATHVAREVARALHHAHVAPGPDGAPLGLVHRDVSPQNVLVSFAGEVKLTDFGIAKAASRSVATGVGIIKGKSAYMSPEQARGDPLDARSDVFALGIVLWEALTGRRLFIGDSDTEILRAVQVQPAAAPSTIRADVPAALDAVVLRALSKERDDRFENAAAFEAALTDVLLRHAAGATDLDLSTWMASLFPEEIGEALRGLDPAVLDPPGRDGTAAALPTPPGPGDAETIGQRPSLKRAEITADLPTTPDRPEGGRRRRRVAFAAAGALAAGAAFLVFAGVLPWPGSAPAASGEAESGLAADGPGDAAIPGAPAEAEGPGAALPDDPPGAGTDEAVPTGDEPARAGETTAVAEPPAAAAAEAEPARAPTKQARRPPPGRPARRPAQRTAARTAPAAEEAPTEQAPAPEAQAWTGGATVLAAPSGGGHETAASASTVIPAGTRLSARLSLGVETGSAEAVEARLSRSLFFEGAVRLPRNTRLTGVASERGDRVTLRFQRAVPPAGGPIALDAVAYGRDGRPGLAALDGLTGGGGQGLTLPPGTEITVVLTADLVLD